jgi:NADPH:quinone reductase-like Zn-dependent oxidoreductase
LFRLATIRGVGYFRRISSRATVERYTELLMKAIAIEQFGDVKGLKVVDRPEPKIGGRQVLVRMHAASLNYRDLVVLRGQYDRTPQLGRIPLSDGAGEVVSVGPEVTRFKPGDRVAGCFFQGWISGRFRPEFHKTALGGSIDGVLAEFGAFSEQGIVPVPSYLTLVEAATLPCAALTAWQALVVRGKLAAGESVLLLGTGGVSIFGLQFAKANGAKVIITSSSDAKLQRARELGADECINYQATPDWGKEAVRLSGTDGVDHVIEVGGAGTFSQSVRACRSNGHIGLIGILAGRETSTEIFSIVPKGLNVYGIYVGSREMFEEMNRALEQNRIHPVVDKVFPFAEAAEAFRFMESGSHFGKIVIEFDR